MAREVAFGNIEKSPDAVRLVKLEWFDLVATLWEAGKQHSANDVVRPRSPTGFAYQAGGAGQAGLTEPAWPTTLSDTVVDGEITWTAIAAGSNGVTAISGPSVTIVPSGTLSSGAASVVDGEGTNTRTQFTLSNGTVGKRYRVQVTVTAGTETLVGSLYVDVDVK